VKVGNAKLVEKKYQEAIDYYTQAIDLTPSNAIYYCNRAAAYSQQSKHEDAVMDCETAISIDPSYAKAYSRLGLARFSLGKFSDAIEAYTQGLTLDPGNESMKQGLSAAEQKLKEPMAAATASSQKDADMPRAGGGGAPGAGGLGGMDFASLMNNPAIMNMAQQFMSNPDMAGMLGNLMGGLGGGQGQGQEGAGPGAGGNPLANLMSNPEVRRMAEQLKDDPNMADAMKNMKK
jgi:small glutamine-rich tetratricopeptide repeat-containing protein alpha